MVILLILLILFPHIGTILKAILNLFELNFISKFILLDEDYFM